MAKTIIGILPNRELAQDAVERLQELDYDPKEMTIILKDDDKKGAKITGSATGGAVSGVTTGGVVGALAGLLVSAGILPGIGALFIGGPLVAALGPGGAAAVTASGAATGALAGGVLGLLGQLGLSAQDAKNYEARIKEGGVVVAVPARNGDEDEVKHVLTDHDAEQIRTVDMHEHEGSFAAF